MTHWTYETTELSEGFCTSVYDEHGKRIADWVTEEQARLIVAAPRLRSALEQLMFRWNDYLHLACKTEGADSAYVKQAEEYGRDARAILESLPKK